MPPFIATILCVAFIAYLFWRDRCATADRISWVPFAWMLIAGSRFVSTWLHLRAPGGTDAYAEGSPVDRAVFLTLIVCGVIVLARRSVNWREVLSGNKLLVLYFLYCLVSIVWADDAWVLVRRWVKELGNPIMVLIMLTERRPYHAVVTTVKRLSFVFLPLSVLFIKYYPEIGRGYTATGAPMYTGVGDQKNQLGMICLTTGLVYLWSFIQTRRPVLGVPWWSQVVMVVSLVWLLYMADSQTAVVCLILATLILCLSLSSRVQKKPRRLMDYVAVAAIALFVVNALFGVSDVLFHFLGRNSTLTNRTTIWDVVESLQPNPLVGAGFMSFWMGDRLNVIAAALGTRGLNQAHNGYLEQYLNLGYIGIAFIAALVFATLWRIRPQLAREYRIASLRFSIIAAALAYNYTEASFYGLNNMWILLLASCMAAPGVTTRSVFGAPARANSRRYHARQMYCAFARRQVEPTRSR